MSDYRDDTRPGAFVEGEYLAEQEDRARGIVPPAGTAALIHTNLNVWARAHVTFVAPDGRTLTEEEAAEWLRRARS